MDLTEEERAIQETAHRFAAEVLRPAGIKLDKLADPQDVIAKDSILWGVFKKHRVTKRPVSPPANACLPR